MLKETIALGSYSLLLVLTFTSYSTIVTKIHQQQGHRDLGPILLACSFGSFMLMNSFAPSLPFKFKTQFILAGICYIMSYITVIPNWGVSYLYFGSIIGVIFGGIGASIFWISQGAYMDTLCTQQQTKQRGKYFGILNVFIFANLILAAIVTTFSLGYFSDEVYYIILTVIGILALIFGVFFIKDIQDNQQAEIKIQNKKQLSFKQMIINACLYYPKMKAIIPLCILDGIGMGLTLSLILHLIPQTGQRKQDDFNAGILQIILGFGAIIGAFVSGYLCDKISVTNVGYSSLIFVMITSWMTVAADKIEAIWAAYIAAFFWGYMLVICSKVYGGQPQAFAVNKQVHSLSFVLFQITLILTDDNLDIKLVCFFIIIFSLPALYFLKDLPPCRIQKEMQSQSNNQNPVLDI